MAAIAELQHFEVKHFVAASLLLSMETFHDDTLNPVKRPSKGRPARTGNRRLSAILPTFLQPHAGKDGEWNQDDCVKLATNLEQWVGDGLVTSAE